MSTLQGLLVLAFANTDHEHTTRSSSVRVCKYMYANVTTLNLPHKCGASRFSSLIDTVVAA